MAPVTSARARAKPRVRPCEAASSLFVAAFNGAIALGAPAGGLVADGIGITAVAATGAALVAAALTTAAVGRAPAPPPRPPRAEQ